MRFVSLLLTTICFAGCASTAPNPSADDVGVPIGNANPPNTNCSPNNVWEQYSGTWLLTKPDIKLVFWGDWWLNGGLKQYDALAKAWTTLGNDPDFYAPLAQYGISPGSMSGTYNTYPDLPTGSLTEDAIQTELLNELANGVLPENDSSTVYVIELPPDTTSVMDTTNGFIGHHGDAKNTSYAVIEHGTTIQMDWVSSHEIYEAATDPDCGTGWWAGSGETEVGDLCVGQTYQLDGYTIQKVWDQKNCVCGP